VTAVVVVAPIVSDADIDAMMAVERASFTNPWTRDMYLSELANPTVSRFLLARTAGNQIVGFCSFWLIVDELHINNVAVLPECRGAGIGSALIRRAFREAREAGAVRALLEVRRSNEAARRLYERFGFHVIRVRREYYTQPIEDALVLGCEPLPAEGS
jgi:ribosomal-protein-alanine N-acetyltransferase